MSQGELRESAYIQRLFNVDCIYIRVSVTGPRRAQRVCLHKAKLERHLRIHASVSESTQAHRVRVREWMNGDIADAIVATVVAVVCPPVQ